MPVPNFPDHVGQYQMLVLPCTRQLGASVTALHRIKMPAACTLIGVSATARASGGTAPTLTVNVLEGGVTVLSAPFAVTAGTVTEGTITDAELADESIVTIDLAIGGTSPTWDDVSVQLDLLRHS